MIRNPYGTEDVWCVCVVCSAPGLYGRVYSAPSYSVAGGLLRRGPFIAAARGSSMALNKWWSSLYMVWTMVTEIVPNGNMFSKRGHLWPQNIGHCTQGPIHGSWWSSFVNDV